MEPRIQYAKTSDGVNVAYCDMGKGQPLVYASNVWGDIHWYRHNEATRAEVDRLVASGWRVVRYDARGMGSSDRDVSDFSLEARISDLDSVVSQLDLDRFVLCGYSQAGPVAIAYAVRSPERVSHLILVNSFAVGSMYYKKLPSARAVLGIREMAEEQWEFFTLTIATAVTKFRDASEAKRTSELFKTSMSPNTYLQYTNATEHIDVTELLPKVQVPTLVIQDHSALPTEELSRALATGIPGAQFTSGDDYPQELHAFVRADALASSPPSRRLDAIAPSGTAIILFADIADSTALTERLGDTVFREKARDLDSALRAIIREHSGTPIEGKLLGDGVLAVFTSARQAIEAALACARSGDDAGLPLHLGLHAGDVIREENNVYGGAVNIASRISGLSAPGEVLVSETVRSLGRTSAGPSVEGFEDRGEQAVKGVGGPVRVWTVGEGKV